jgi:voltage-gated potassium channel Kch
MAARLFWACLLMALCVVIHAAGVAGALRRLRKKASSINTFSSSVLLFVLLAVWVVLLHLSEIAVWAAAFVLQGALPTFETALYFSAVTYTTTGYGDVVLPPRWRLDGGVEALTGILMCGWSTAFFFAIVTRLHEARWGTAES